MNSDMNNVPRKLVDEGTTSMAESQGLSPSSNLVGFGGKSSVERKKKSSGGVKTSLVRTRACDRPDSSGELIPDYGDLSSSQSSQSLIYSGDEERNNHF
jgi:hypothetical protein